MSELRAPDPTLTATDVRIVYVSNYLPGGARSTVPVAHVWDDKDCGAQLVNGTSPDRARWFAVPCRECFPDAPPPGTELSRGGVLIEFDALAWQVLS